MQKSISRIKFRINKNITDPLAKVYYFKQIMIKKFQIKKLTKLIIALNHWMPKKSTL